MFDSVAFFVATTVEDQFLSFAFIFVFVFVFVKTHIIFSMYGKYWVIR